MKKIITVLAAGSAMVMAASAANAASVSATATAEILQQVQIAKTADLNFGSIVPDSAASANVIVDPDGTNTRNCGGLTCADDALVSSAAFNVTGATGLTAVISLSSLATIDDGGNSMNISLSQSDATLLMTGSAVPTYVGGTLTVPANQAPGTYSGSFDVTAEYQ